MKGNKKVLGIAALAAVAAVGGSFAYFNQTMTIENPFDTGKYGSVAVENFDPSEGTQWKPGAEVNKDFEVINTGDQPIVVRVKFEDFWKTNANDSEDDAFKKVPAKDATTVQQGDGSDAAKNDGKYDTDLSVVHKKLLGVIDADHPDNNWYFDEASGYYYFMKPLTAAGTAGQTDRTGKFLESVTLDKDTDMGKLIKVRYYTTDANAEVPDFSGTDLGTWKKLNDTDSIPAESKKNAVATIIEKDDEGNPLKGYSDAHYTLKITVETVQATKEAAEALFNDTEKNIVIPEAVATAWNLSSEQLAE